MGKRSKATKKAWKKVDVTEVEVAQDEIMHEKRELGKEVRELENEELFFVDTKGSKGKSRTKGTQEVKVLKCWEKLGPSCLYPTKFKGLSRSEKQRVDTLTKKIKSGEISEKRESGIGKKRTRVEADLWDEPQPSKVEEDDFLNDVVVKRPPKVPSNRFQKPAPHVAATSVPSGGLSYMPDPEEHEDTVAVAVAKEIDAIDRRTILNKRLGDVLATAKNRRSRRVAVEESEESDSNDSDSDSESDSDANSGSARQMQTGQSNQGDDESGDGETAQATKSQEKEISKQSVPERKTRKQLNREARKKEEEKKRAALLKIKDQRKQLDNLPNIVSEIAQDEIEADRMRELKEVRSEDKKLKPKRLGPYKLGTKSDFALSEELSGSLRTTQVQTKLLADRFRSLQERELIEPRKRVLKKKKRKVMNF